MDSERIFEIIRSRLECKRMSDDPVAWDIIENEKKIWSRSVMHISLYFIKMSILRNIVINI